MQFLIALLVFIIVFAAIWFVGKWYLRRKIKDTFGIDIDAIFGKKPQKRSSRNSSNKRESGRGRTSSGTRKPTDGKDKHKKVFDDDEGTYVDYVEVKE